MPTRDKDGPYGTIVTMGDLITAEAMGEPEEYTEEDLRRAFEEFDRENERKKREREES